MLKELKEKQFHFKKRLGQNFLTDKNLLRSICLSAGIDKNTTVLEIGAGAGTLTEFLAEYGKKVVSYEIDKGLQSVLSEKFMKVKNVRFIFKDFMKEKMSDVEKELQDNYMVVANIPYYITTPLIFKIIEEGSKVTNLVLMVQEEVANRFIAKAGTKEYGAVSVMLNYYGNVKIIKKVRRELFTPVPDVDSCVIKIDLYPNKYKVNKEIFSKCVRAAFENRRKIYLGNLKKTFSLPENKLIVIFEKLKLDKNIRGEKLSVEQFVSLSNELSEFDII